VNGDSFDLAANSVIAMINGQWAIFCYGAKHTWLGTLTYAGYTFASDANDPLQFQVDENKGYVYIHGKGTVTMPDKSIVRLGSDAGPDGNAPATPTTAASPAILFQDNFDSNANGWDTGKQSDTDGDLDRQIIDGKYRLALTSKQDYFYAISSIPKFSAKDFLFSIDATVLDISATPGDLELGFTLREANGVDGKRYEFLFYNDNTFAINLWPSADPQTIKSLLTGNMGTAKLEKGATNTFAIQANGSTFTFYIDGNKIDSFTDTTIDEAGSISIWLGLLEADQSVTMEFDNLTIQAIP